MPLPSVPDDRSKSLLSRLSAFEAVLALGGLAVFMLMLLEMRAFLGPLLLGLTAIMLLWPLRHRKTVRAVLVTTTFLLVLWLLYSASGVLAPFIVAYILAYVLAPLVEKAHRRFQAPRWLSSALFTLLLLGVVILIVVLLVPKLVAQVQQLANSLLRLASRLPEELERSALFDQLASMGIIDRQGLEERVSSFISERLTWLAQQAPALLRQLLQSIGSVLGLITLLAVTPVVLFYMLRDFPKMNTSLRQLLPTVRGNRDYLAKVDEVVGNYFRGQLLISLIAGINVGFWFSIFGVPFALLLGVIAGLLNLIPQIGAILTNVLASVIAIAFGDPWLTKLIVVQVVLVGQSLLEQAVLTPNIMSTQVGLHPVLIIVALFFFGHFLGFLGFLIAVPATALLVALYQAFSDYVHFDLAGYSQRPEEEEA